MTRRRSLADQVANLIPEIINLEVKVLSKKRISQKMDLGSETKRQGTTNKLVERVPLTDEQIDGILREVPNPPGAGKSMLQIARNQIVEQLRDYLEQDIRLPPIQAAYEDFKRETIEAIYQSFIEAGTPVGVHAGTALGGPLTQMTLNTFHFAGQQSGVASAFNQVRDFLTGTKANRNPSMKIFLKDPTSGSNLHDVFHVGTNESIYAMRPELEETTVQDLVSSHEVLIRDEAISEGVPEAVLLHSRLRPERYQSIEYRFPMTYVLLLNLNTYRMWTHKITMMELAQSIEGSFPPNSLTCVWKSQLEGKMYVLVDELRDHGLKVTSHQTGILMFLSKQVIPKMDEWTVKGIRGIVAIEPREVVVVDAIERVQYLEPVEPTRKGGSQRRNPNRWIPVDQEGQTLAVDHPGQPKAVDQIVVISQKKTRTEGPSLYDVYRLLVVAGFNILKVDIPSLEITVRHEENVLTALNKRIAEARSATEPTPTQKQIVAAAGFSYILTNGSNFDEIIWRDDVDLYRSYPVNSHEISGILGIDAARLFLIDEFTRTLENFSSYINNRHIVLMFDLLTNLGLVNSLTFAGVNRRALGPVTAASHQQAMSVFANSSIFGDNEKILGISPAMYVGQQSTQIGTGAIGTITDETIQPTDRPGMPDSDQIISGDPFIDEAGATFDGMGFAGLLAEKETEVTAAALGAVDKKAILVKGRITDKPPSVTYDSLVPAGGTVSQVSSTLMSALSKVTSGTNIEFVSTLPDQTDQPIIDITEVDLADIEIGPVKRGQPFSVLDQLVAAPSSSLMQVASDASYPEPTSLPPAKTELTGIPSNRKGIQVNRFETIKATLLNVPVPTPPSPPALPNPRPPRSTVKVTAPALPAATTFDFASFIAELPPVEKVVSAPVQKTVKPIDVTKFIDVITKK